MTCLKITQWVSRLSYTGVRLNELRILSETLCIRVSDPHIIVERNASPQKQQHHQHQGACWTRIFLGSTPDLVIHNLLSPEICVSTSTLSSREERKIIFL